MTSPTPDVLPPETEQPQNAAPVAPRDALTEFGKIDIGLERATEIANQLSAVIKQNGLAAQIKGGKKHLLVEAWQTCGMMVGVSAKTEWTREVRDPVGGTLDGYDARVQVIRMATGQVIGAAESSCHFDEQLKKRDGTIVDRWLEHGRPNRHACKSMAQTRATSKALAQVLRWIPVLAGYSGTPYEEMTDESRGHRDEDPPTREDERRDPAPSTTGTVTRTHIYRANFIRSEEVHGKSEDSKIKFAPLNWAVAKMEYEKFDQVPDSALEELASLIPEYTPDDVPF